MSDATLILAPPLPLDPIKLSSEGEQLLEVALVNAALIGKVSNADENNAAVTAQADLKRITSMFDKAGKAIRDPHTKFCKDVIAFVDEKCKEANRELARVSTAIGSFQQLELAKQRAAENAARLEAERIENERLAEERRVREAAEAEQQRLSAEAAEAQRKASESTDVVEREAAEALQRQIETQKQVAQAASLEAIDAIRENAAEKAAQAQTPAYVPVRAEGQRVAVEWEITRINELQLAKARPDLIRKIEFDMRALKAELARGVKLPGVEAKEGISASVRTGVPKMIEV